MSLSKIFKQDNSFVPKKLLPDSKAYDETLILTSVSIIEEQDKADTITPIPADVPVNSSGKDTSTIDSKNSPPNIENIRQEAYLLGIKEGKEQALAKFTSTVEAMTNCCTEIDALRADVLENSREEMINLIIAVSKKIILDELKTNRNTIAHLLEKSLQAAIQSEEIHIILNPEDLRVAVQIKPRLISTIRGLKSIVLKSNPLITSGGCKLESNVCEVDATIESRLDTIKNHLEDNAGNHEETEQPTPEEDL